MGFYALDKVKYGGLGHSMARNYIVKRQIWLDFELVQDFIDVLVTGKFKEDSIKF